MGTSCGVHQSAVRPHPVNPLLLDSHCWGCTLSLFREWYNCLSMQCGLGGLGDGKGMPVGSCGSLRMCLACCLMLWQQTLLLHSASMASARGHELLDRESPLVHLAIFFLLPSTEGDLAQDGGWACEHLLLLDRDWAVAITLLRPALTRHLLSSSCSSDIKWSRILQASTLGATSYCPLHTHSATSRISWLVDHRSILRGYFFGHISLLWVGVPSEVLLSFLSLHCSCIMKQPL